MEARKTAETDPENKKNHFVMSGLVLAEGAVLLAFEWTSRPSQVASPGIPGSTGVEEEFIPVTRREEMKPSAPPLTPARRKGGSRNAGSTGISG